MYVIQYLLLHFLQEQHIKNIRTIFWRRLLFHLFYFFENINEMCCKFFNNVTVWKVTPINDFFLKKHDMTLQPLWTKQILRFMSIKFWIIYKECFGSIIPRNWSVEYGIWNISIEWRFKRKNNIRKISFFME